MSYKINPEDVPIDFIAKHLKGRLFAESVYEADILVIINAAIEAGLVSPPCHVSRDEFGNCDRLYDGAVILRANPHPYRKSEHWKGQTE